MAKKLRKTNARPKSPKVYEFKCSLKGTSPLVWRKFLAHDFIELPELHMLIQMTMGWQATHLYEFKIGSKSYVSTESSEEMDAADAEGIRLSDVIQSFKKFSYLYDFGDGWDHEIEILNSHEPDSRITYPVCVGGENACPPEDCGGIHGFSDLKEVLAGKDCEEKEVLLKWVGGFYDPTTFDPNFVNRHFLWADF